MNRRIGNPDSKYTYNPGQLDIDIVAKQLEHEEFKRTIRNLILDDPSKMDLRYQDVIEVLKELKEEYGL